MFLIPKDFYQVRKTKNKGRGVFALKHIPAGTLIGDYVGRVVSDAEADILEEKYGQGCYSFEYVGEDVSLFPVDLKAEGVHLINHSCAANCNVSDVEGHNVFFALRHIFPGEEITFDYEFDPESDGGVSYCFCDSPFCRGTMYARVEKPNLKIKVKKEKKKKEGRPKYHVHKVGEILPPLAKYPKEIKDNHRKYNIFSYLKVPPLVNPATALPMVKELREQMRLTGRRIKFPKLNMSVLAVVDDHLVVER
ncbi:MAG: SET domain-containing protein [Candidatus Falkowbacteria bacterium]